MRYFLLMAALVFAVVFTSCLERPGGVKKDLPRAYATSRVFKFGTSELRDTILKIFEIKEQSGNPYLTKIFYYYFPKNDTIDEHRHTVTFSTETSEDGVFVEEYFRNSGRLHDIYLKQFDHWNSPVYFVNGKSLLFTADYVLLFYSLESRKRKLL